MSMGYVKCGHRDRAPKISTPRKTKHRGGRILEESHCTECTPVKCLLGYSKPRSMLSICVLWMNGKQGRMHMYIYCYGVRWWSFGCLIHYPLCQRTNRWWNVVFKSSSLSCWLAVTSPSWWRLQGPASHHPVPSTKLHTVQSQVPEDCKCQWISGEEIEPAEIQNRFPPRTWKNRSRQLLRCYCIGSATWRRDESFK